MKRIITVFIVLYSMNSGAQVFNGVPGNILNNGQPTYFDNWVSGLSQANIDTVFGIQEVCVSITHPVNAELDIYLQSPAGTLVQLALSSSNSGSDFTNTCFDNSSGSSITLGTAPYIGTYKPVGFLGRFNTGQNGNGSWHLIIKDYLAFVNSGTLMSWQITFGNTPSHPVQFSSSNLPIVNINTSGQGISDNDVLVSLGIIDNGASQTNHISDLYNNYNNKARIHIRGHTSRTFEKKCYAFTTTNALGGELDVPILGMPKEHDWILLAPYIDKSLIRDPLTYDLFREMGHYSPRVRNVEVVIDGEYRGVYELMEKVKRDVNRINIPEMTTVDNSEPNITGGYIVKIDRTDAPGFFSLYPGDCINNAHFYYQYVYPGDSDITPQQSTYLKSFLDSFETALNNSEFDINTGYFKYIDVNSFVDFFILNELSKNVDAYRLSTFLFKDRSTNGGKLSIGPMWDYDLAWHNCNYGNSFDPTGWEFQVADTAFPVPVWWSRFEQDSNFVDRVWCRWHELRQGLLSINNLMHYIDSSASVLNAGPQQRNFKQWPVLNSYIFCNPQNQASMNFQNEVNDLKTWVSARIIQMDGFIQGQCPSIFPGIHENNADQSVSVYPNPGNGVFYLTGLDLGKEISVYNVTGEVVYKTKTQNNSGIDISSFAKGVYFVQCMTNNSVVTKKLIVD